MADLTTSPSEHSVAFETYGVRVALRAPDATLLARARELTPPHSRPCEPQSATHRFSLTTEIGDGISVQYDLRDGVPAQPVDPNSWIATAVDLEFALGLLESYWHGAIGLYAPEHTLIHAGVVAHQGRLIVLPAKGLTGKTTLVAALARQGATYYSDEFAVLDKEGLVHPYATPLFLRPEDWTDPTARPVPAPESPLPIGAIVATSYFPGAEWRPRRLSQGEGVLALLSQAVPAQERPDETFGVIKRALSTAPVMIESLRDEADEVASLLLAELEREPAARA
jgi:hypothetical protein